MTLIQAQERLISRINSCHPGHRNRVIRSAAYQLRTYLASRGTSDDIARQVVRDAIDMANLEAGAE